MLISKNVLSGKNKSIKKQPKINGNNAEFATMKSFHDLTKNGNLERVLLVLMPEKEEP